MCCKSSSRAELGYPVPPVLAGHTAHLSAVKDMGSLPLGWHACLLRAAECRTTQQHMQPRCNGQTCRFTGPRAARANGSTRCEILLQWSWCLAAVELAAAREGIETSAAGVHAAKAGAISQPSRDAADCRPPL